MDQVIPELEAVKSYKKIVANGIENGIGINIAQSLLPPKLRPNRLDVLRQGSPEPVKIREPLKKQAQSRAQNGF